MEKAGYGEAQDSMTWFRDPLGGFSLLYPMCDRLGVLSPDILRSSSISLQCGVLKSHFADEDTEAHKKWLTQGSTAIKGNMS